MTKKAKSRMMKHYHSVSEVNLKQASHFDGFDCRFTVGFKEQEIGSLDMIT